MKYRVETREDEKYDALPDLYGTREQAEAAGRAWHNAWSQDDDGPDGYHHSASYKVIAVADQHEELVLEGKAVRLLSEAAIRYSVELRKSADMAEERGHQSAADALMLDSSLMGDLSRDLGAIARVRVLTST